MAAEAAEHARRRHCLLAVYQPRRQRKHMANEVAQGRRHCLIAAKGSGNPHRAKGVCYIAAEAAEHTRRRHCLEAAKGSGTHTGRRRCLIATEVAEHTRRRQCLAAAKGSGNTNRAKAVSYGREDSRNAGRRRYLTSRPEPQTLRGTTPETPKSARPQNTHFVGLVCSLDALPSHLS